MAKKAQWQEDLIAGGTAAADAKATKRWTPFQNIKQGTGFFGKPGGFLSGIYADDEEESDYAYGSPKAITGGDTDITEQATKPVPTSDWGKKLAESDLEKSLMAGDTPSGGAIEEIVGREPASLTQPDEEGNLDSAAKRFQEGKHVWSGKRRRELKEGFEGGGDLGGDYAHDEDPDYAHMYNQDTGELLPEYADEETGELLPEHRLDAGTKGALAGWKKMLPWQKALAGVGVGAGIYGLSKQDLSLGGAGGGAGGSGGSGGDLAFSNYGGSIFQPKEYNFTDVTGVQEPEYSPTSQGLLGFYNK